jgi:hypothetical protein
MCSVSIAIPPKQKKPQVSEAFLFFEIRLFWKCIASCAMLYVPRATLFAPCIIE